MQVEEARSGARFNVPEAKPGIFYRLYGGDQLMITLEYVDSPADMAVFQQPLASTVTGMMCPDIRERLTRNRAHILVNVSHGVLGGVASDPKIAALLRDIGMQREGGSLPQFMRRLDILGLISRIVCDKGGPSALHWTQSNQLFSGEAFDILAGSPAPNHLHVHPYLFGKARGAGGEPEIGIRTFGVRHFIGREILVNPSVLPWAANFETVMAFLRVATMDKGYIIPDTDTFGPDNGSLSYRVLHRDAEEGDVPLYELVPLLHREYGFQADDYVPRDRRIDDRAPPPALMPADQEEKQALANEWREKHALAEGVGGSFEVRARGDAPIPPPVTPPRTPLLGRRAVFGRKGIGG
jgi:hypothetical protein